MEYTHLGGTGLQVSRLCLGTMQFGWSLGEAESHRLLSYALGAGINFLDTADIYSRWVEGNPGGVAEEIIGRWMKAAKVPRTSLVIATKVRGRMGDGPNDEGLSRTHILAAVEDSLRRLRCEYIDLYQLHWPDERTPIEETLGALSDLVRQGKVRYIGLSNFPAWRVVQALWACEANGWPRIASLQPHYNLIHRAEFERELRAVCAAYGLGVIPYSPLAGGFLTGKYRPGQQLPDSRRAEGRRKMMTQANFLVLDRVEELARSRQATLSQVALAWLLADPVVTCPIVGATSPRQLEENLAALSVQLSHDEKAGLDELTDWAEA